MTTTEVAPVTGAVTTRFTPPSGGKKFAWSYSKIKNSDICPKRHYEIDIAKKVQDTGGEALVWGDQVHKAMHARLAKKVTLPAEMSYYEAFAKRLEDKCVTMDGTLQVEQKYAFTREFGPTGYFSPDVWFRGIGDALIISGSGRTALIVDWKTGRLLEDSVQLALMAQCIFSTYPEVQRVAARFAWLKEHAETDEVFTRQDMVRFWTTMLPRVQRYEQMVDDVNWPATPNKLCYKYCPVITCPNHGKSFQ